jgi:hypothetical protein
LSKICLIRLIKDDGAIKERIMYYYSRTIDDDYFEVFESVKNNIPAILIKEDNIYYDIICNGKNFELSKELFFLEYI